ncbi:hypothetical protein KAR91_61105 [Candidatus Pacearchaeota archaeon]|nr:hypothetical protein [Candidatus Pacearchaeota archaeon]
MIPDQAELRMKAGKKPTILFSLELTPSSFKAIPKPGDTIEIEIYETIHIVFINSGKITYSYADRAKVKGEGTVLDSYEKNDHPLKQAVDKAVRENQS